MTTEVEDRIDAALDRAFNGGRFEMVAFLTLSALTGALFGMAVVLWAQSPVTTAVLIIAGSLVVLCDYMIWSAYRYATR